MEVQELLNQISRKKVSKVKNNERYEVIIEKDIEVTGKEMLSYSLYSFLYSLKK
jgi:hypothetical protein